jgi:tyrosyl-tRNA synthetase
MAEGSIHPRNVKVNLAKNICTQFYNSEIAEQAAAEFDRIFVNKEIPDDVNEYRIPEGEKGIGKIWIVRLIVLAGLAATNGEARRLVRGGGVYLDGRKILDEDFELTFPIRGILKVGKRKFVRIAG